MTRIVGIFLAIATYAVSATAQSIIITTGDGEDNLPEKVVAYGWDYVSKEKVERTVSEPSRDFDRQGIEVVSSTVDTDTGAAQFNPTSLKVTISNDTAE